MTNFRGPEPRAGWLIAAAGGALVWLGGAIATHPAPLTVGWGQLLLMLAALVLVPLGLSLVPEPPAGRTWRVASVLAHLAALLLGCAYLLPQGPAAGALSLPWLAFTGLLACAGLQRARAARSLGELSIAAALVFVLVGSGWAALDRVGQRPLGFDPIIVFLTGVHFHYAGFVLPLVAGLAVRQSDGAAERLAVLGALASVPAVAVGITTTQLGGSPLVEALAAWAMALAGTLVAMGQIQAGLRARPPAARALLLIAGLSLAGSMVLAALYGARFYRPVAWLDIPWMRALHGSANALGFALPALLGWALIRRQPVASAEPAG
jgi:hypothetical protein